MKCLILLVCAAIPIATIAQDQRFQNDAARIAEELVAIQDEDIDYETLYENVLQILANPINLNSATAEDLRQLLVLNENQIAEIIFHRSASGNFISPYELQGLKSLDEQTIQGLMPLLKVNDPLTTRSMIKRVLDGNNYFMTRFERTVETKTGFKALTDSLSRFQGSPDKIYARFRSSRTKDYSIGFTTESDAGEKIQWAPAHKKYGFDFVSYHFQLQNKGRIKNIVVGDFQAQFGQGIILGGGFGLGKGGEVVNAIRKSNVGILPYSSVNETGFYRGAAMTMKVAPHWFMTGLYSGAKRDASLNDDSIRSISSFLFTGLHRNQNELSTRKMITEKSYSLILNYVNETLDAGIILNEIDFSRPILKRPSPYNQFAFSGGQNKTIGSFLNFHFQNINFFSELAANLSGGKALISGILASVHQQVDISLLFRTYDKNYYSFYSNAFAENSQPQNETGLYWGLKYKLSRKYSISAYADIFRFPWLGFRRYVPTHGYEWLIRMDYQPNRKTTLSFQGREEKKARNIPGDGFVYWVADGRKRNLWLKFNYSLSPAIAMKTQVQWNSYSLAGSNSTGFSIAEDLSYVFGKFQVTARHAIFDSRNFDNRTYLYENDAYMAFSIPAYYGVGTRDYILLEYKLSRALSLWARYARSRIIDKNEMGTGVDTIAGNIRKDVKFQALFKF